MAAAKEVCCNEDTMQDALYRRQAKPPLFARLPLVGLILVAIGLLIFGLLTLDVLAHGPLVPVDQALISAIHTWARQCPPFVVSLMRRGSDMGYWGVALLTLVAAIVCLARRAWRELAIVVLGVIGAEALFQIISPAINRPRPHFPDPFEGLRIAGFPSGHSTTSVALYLLLLYILVPHLPRLGQRLALILVGFLLIDWIMFSRLFLGSHFPTDVLAGAALGLAWAALVATSIDLYAWRRLAAAAPDSAQSTAGAKR
jgi:membrane-associated phospholipid phosphatase